jgi:hypothetical protein
MKQTITALMLAENRTMRDLLDRLGPVRVIDQERGTVDVEVAIPDVGVAPELREMLRIGARHQAGASTTRGIGLMKEQPSAVAKLGRVTDEVRRILRDGENEPVGVLSAYRNSILRLADAIDRLAEEIDSRTERR